MTSVYYAWKCRSTYVVNHLAQTMPAARIIADRNIPYASNRTVRRNAAKVAKRHGSKSWASFYCGGREVIIDLG